MSTIRNILLIEKSGAQRFVCGCQFVASGEALFSVEVLSSAEAFFSVEAFSTDKDWSRAQRVLM